MEKGRLSVQTENILPIIKKWLYSEKEIFLRELVSNAFDAITKVRKISLSEEIYQAEDHDYAIDISIDREKKILTLEDNGIGMDAEEIKKYITQIAFSGAEDFVRKYEESGEKGAIIGNFGLGFYSSFMVASKVEIESRSSRPDAQPALWTSDGTEYYELGEGSRDRRGTLIRLHMEESELLDKARLNELIRKYCDFVPVPIRVDGAQVNRQEPLWIKPPAGLKKEDYQEFYKYLYPLQGDPLFYVHLNVDYPFRLQGILYFPRLAHEMDLNRSNIKIYCKQVFVSDEAQELIPKFLTVLQGMLDLPDLPLNVSRSYLQNEPQIRKIAQHIVKKVADRLNEEFKNSREEYAKIWPDIAPFVKFAAINDVSFYDQVAQAVLFEAFGDEKTEHCTLEEYVVNNKTKTDGRIYYTSDPVAQAGPLKLLKSQGIQVLHLNTLIDTHFLHFLESRSEDYRFVRIDADVAETILDRSGESQLVDADNKDLNSRISDLFRRALGNDKIQIRVEALKSDELPAMILLPEHARRFSEMAAHWSSNQPAFPEEHTLLLNSRNPIVRNLAAPRIISGETASDEKGELIARQIYALARLSQGGMTSNEVDSFVHGAYQLLEKVF